MKVTVYSVYDTFLDDCDYELVNILDIQLKLDDNKIFFNLLSANGRSFLLDSTEFRLVVSYE